ncbi:MAG: V-type ATP synthase subunit I [Candidatus Muiribacteriota bacterium]
MALQKVIKLGVIVLKEKKQELVRLLHKFGNIQFVSKDDKENISNTEKIDDKLINDINQIKNALALIQEYGEKKGFADLFKPKKEYTLDKLEEFSKSTKKETAFLINEKRETLKSHESNLMFLEQNKEKYSKWEFTKIPFHISNNLIFTSIHFIAGNPDKFSLLEQKLSSENMPYELKTNQEGNTSYGVLFTLKEHEASAVRMAADSGLIVEYYDIDKSFDEEIAEIEKQIIQVTKEISNVKNEITELAEIEEELSTISDSIELVIEEKNALNKFAETEYTSYVKIWVAEKDSDKLRTYLSKNIQELEIMELPVEEEEKVPVIFSGNSFTSPFHAITSMYGIPDKGEFDPTPLFAPFFVLFFGYCLSDAGYGLVILLASIYGMTRKTIDKEVKKAMALMMYCGLSTMVIGALFGGWFGLPLDTMDNFVSRFLLSFKMVDPNKDALLILGIGLLLGVIQILWSKMIAAYKSFANGNMTAFFEEVLWFIYLGFFFPSVIKYAGYIEGMGWLYSGFLYMAIIMIVFYLVTDKSNIFLRPFLSGLKLYDTIGYFGDVLSYARLMALGLATGGVALAINLIAGIVGDMIPVVGIFIQIAILIFGHAFNLVMNILGSFVHSMRLQFVEFFRKFFEGGGTAFKPFKMTPKYVRVIKD